MATKDNNIFLYIVFQFERSSFSDKILASVGNNFANKVNDIVGNFTQPGSSTTSLIVEQLLDLLGRKCLRLHIFTTM